MKAFNRLTWAILAFTTIPYQMQGQQHAIVTSSDIEPGAIAALNKMGTYLRSLKALQVRAETYKEDVLVDGQKIQFASVTDLLAQAPNRLMAEINSDLEVRRYLYDGKTFTLVDPVANYYATVPAPPTTVELINRLEEKYGMDIPFADLFRWGGPNSRVSEITSAEDIGPGQVGGTTCEHYAFRQPGLDWQIWIQLGDYPLPRKIVLTTTTDEAKPQFSAIYTWNLAPSFNEDTFSFTPPPDSHKIVLAETSSAAERK
jgi:hypothetical protein